MPKVKGNEDWDDWVPEYGNASRKGLLSDGTEESSKNDLTTNKEDYKWPKFEVGPHARKRRLLRQFLYQEIAQQYFSDLEGEEEMSKMEKDSTYKTDFQGGGFQVVDIVDSADPEVLSKYPLYTDLAHSVYLDKIKNIKTSFVSNDPQAVFRKASFFSKPFYAELE
ncbi:uncharacterized protein [Halyomorpha halys]|uniref:uncharacterized protein n=1 Tax=Halyomorpha halys TaxID=286706 RepID=UPI0006D4E8B3|nr:uncharacterized protein LOC106684305 [Halyomorpha halys]